ncbi:hypothetical protein BJ973_001050 [Actinoplanes tereljensis]|uniref:Gram-positive cocci surface proteins LPxTG domain-containing protein n=1 Tax=Paractinoplanes tereljensis TaxID=571912 RepID=A0A919NZ49_9ACTN|nr:hypothetical protein [Actinoplanes tereljensis]GIF26606.1 hypothetical protein Ate02nite_93360 [Actinoplanes tereljensis]
MIRPLVVAAAGVLAALLPVAPADAHPMPHTVVTLDVHDRSVTASLQLPAEDFTLASGADPASPTAVRAYLLQHFHPQAMTGTPWRVEIGAVSLSDAEQTGTGPYRELLVSAELTPPPGGNVRHFRLGYDAVVHQVVTHTVLVSARDGGTSTEIGVIGIERQTMTVPDLTVDLGSSFDFRPFAGMAAVVAAGLVGAIGLRRRNTRAIR